MGIGEFLLIFCLGGLFGADLNEGNHNMQEKPKTVCHEQYNEMVCTKHYIKKVQVSEVVSIYNKVK